MSLRQRQSGVTMIEILISLFVLAIGILGQMALQATSISSNQSSYYRSQAAVLANDLVDRVRLNPDGAANYGNISLDATSNKIAPSCGTNGCDAAKQTQLDIYELQENLKRSIPSGSLRVSTENVSGKTLYTVTVSWDVEDRAGLVDGDNVNEFTMEFGL